MEEKLIERLESAVARLEALSSGSRPGVSGESGGDAAELDPATIAFDDLIAQYVGRASAAADKIGGQVLDVTKVLAEAFSAQRELLVKVKQSQKPDTSGLAEFLKPLNEVIMKANARTEGRRSDFFNHLKTVADSLTALAWIAFTGKDCGMSMPIAHVEESWQMAEFYSNKILVEYKNKDLNHVEWAKALKELYVPGLRDFVKTHYPLGPVWSATGKSIVSAPSKASTSGAPAPPPPPPASLFSSEPPQSSSPRPKEGMAAVFQEISSGKSVTSGLRKVTDDMKAKNRADRTGIVGASEKETSVRSPSLSKAGPPKFELQLGRKWAVENQIGKKNLVIDDCDAKQSVYIFGCKDSVLQIQGKVNNITVDKCTKMGIVFTDVVAACEIVNCNGVEVQCQGSAPTISVDNTAGCQLYLSKGSLEASITTAKSSEINVLVPGTETDDDWEWRLGLKSSFNGLEPLQFSKMSVPELKERHMAATETVNALRERVKQKRLLLLDTDVEGYAKSQGKAPVCFGPTDLVCCRTLQGHTGKVYSLDWTPEKNRIVSASQDGRLIVWNALTSQKTHAIKLPCAWVMTCAFSPTGQSIAGGGLDSVCSIFNLNSPTDRDGNLPVSRTLSGHKGYVCCCQYVPDEDTHLITGSGDQTCVLWDITTGLKTSVFGGEFQSGHTADVLSVSINGLNSRMFVSGSCDATARLWDTRVASRAVRTFHGHGGDVNAVKFFPDGNRFGTGSDDGTCRLFDIRTGHELQVYCQQRGENDDRHVTSIAFSISGRLLFAGYSNGDCYVWDTLLAKMVLNLGSLQNSHEGRISCLGLSSDGSALCTGSSDTNLKIWAFGGHRRVSD